ncbi:hypothetical protein [Acanthopleuribacter pedis]|uniref:Uncharacterized protein n=1 Tax=Acanthopleuribacter pedis TaxID=442870 RepID=A0A8J7QKK5_9BACT|nr:hypothetical protein [Acanthopleuribacter pedis]MBO1319928.1 hypothetical protein [Acanthopleuribacter pedis]
MSFPSLSFAQTRSPHLTRARSTGDLGSRTKTGDRSSTRLEVASRRTAVPSRTRLNRQFVKQALRFSAVVPRPLLNQIEARFGAKVALALLETPHLQQHLRAEKPLDPDQLARLKQAAQRLGDLGSRPPDVLQFHADALLGRDIDLGNKTESIQQATGLMTQSIKAIETKLADAQAAVDTAKEAMVPIEQELQRLARAEIHCAEELGPLVERADRLRRETDRLQRQLGDMAEDDPARGDLEQRLRDTRAALTDNDEAQIPIRFQMGYIRQQRARQQEQLRPLLQKREAAEGALKREQIKWQPKLSTQREALADFREATRAMQAESTETPRDLETLHGFLGELEKVVDGDARASLADMRTVLKRALYQQVSHDFKRQITEQLAAFRKSGAGKAFSAEVHLGVGASVFGVEVASAKAGVSLEFSISTTDSTQVWESKSAKLSLGLKLGNDQIASVQTDAAGQIAGGTIFNSLEDFVAYHADDLLLALLAASPKDIGRTLDHVSGKRKVAQYQNLVDRNVRLLSPLQQRLIRRGVIRGGDRLVAPSRRKPVPGSFTNKNGTLSVGANLNVLPVGLSASGAGTKTRLDIRNRTALLAALQAEPSKIDSQKSKYFAVNFNGKMLSGKAGKAEMDRMLERLQTLREIQPPTPQSTREVAETRAAIQYALGALEMERQAYIDLVNQYDAGGPHTKGMRQVKHGMEKARGANGRAEMEKAFTVTFAALERLYQNSFPEGVRSEFDEPFFHEQLASIENGFSQPNMVMDHKKMRKNLTVATEKNLEISSMTGTFTVKLGDIGAMLGFRKMGASSDVSVSVTATEVVDKAKPETPTNRLDLTIKVKAGTDFRAVLSALKNAAPSKLAFDFDKPAFGFSEMSLSDWNFSLEANANLQVRLQQVEREDEHGVKQKEMVLQYVRLTAEKGLGGTTPDIAIPTGPVGNAKLSMGAKVKSKHQVFEHVGTKSLGYIAGKFNTWRSAGIQEEQWPAFAQDHKSEFRNLFHNLTDTKNHAGYELAKDLEAVGDEAFSRRILGAYRDYHRQPNEVHFALALDAFTRYLDRKAEGL